MIELIKPCFEIIDFPKNALDKIEIAARTCYKSERFISEDGSSAKSIVNHLVDNNHLAMLEFGGDIHVKLTVSRGISHELVRHRLCSFAQESQRYCNYKDQPIKFIIPHWCDNVMERVVSSPFEDIQGVYLEDLELLFICDCVDSADSYNTRIYLKQNPQDARGCLINDVATDININTNIRDWLHIFELRRSSKAHPDMKLIMNKLYTEFNRRLPIIFK